jgi:hypothetical protein
MSFRAANGISLRPALLWLTLNLAPIIQCLSRIVCFKFYIPLKRGPLSLVSTIEELLGRKSSGSGQETREYGLRDPSR